MMLVYLCDYVAGFPGRLAYLADGNHLKKIIITYLLIRLKVRYSSAMAIAAAHYIKYSPSC